MPQLDDYLEDEQEEEQFEDEGAGDGEPEGRAEEQPAEKAGPQYVTQEEFSQQMQILNNLANSVQSLATGFNAQAMRPQAMPEEKEIPEVTEEEWEEAEGDPKATRRLLRQERARDAQIQRRELAQVRDTGFNAISGLVRDKLESKKYYKEYKVEVDALVEQLPPQARLDPKVLDACYNQVVAVHVDDIEKKIRQEAGRKTALGTQPNTPGSRSGRQVRRTDPDDDDFDLDSDTEEGLEVLGHDRDSFAKSLGYQNWKDYIKKTKV